MSHSMQIFARLVRLLLGETAIAEHKLECGLELVILGVKVSPAVCWQIVKFVNCAPCAGFATYWWC